MPLSVKILSGVNEGLSFPVAAGQSLYVGRNANNQIPLVYDGWASGTHAVFTLRKDQLFLCDLDSTNGTVVHGKLIAKNDYVPVEKFFVIGSTLFSVSHVSLRLDYRPIPLSASRSFKWKDAAIFKTALAFCEGEPALTCAHVFLALLQHHQLELSNFFQERGLALDVRGLEKRIKQKNYFQGTLAWINRYLQLPQEPTSDGIQFLSPKAQNILEKFGGTSGIDPESALRGLLQDDYNLVFPLLNWEPEKEPSEPDYPSTEPFPATGPTFLAQVDPRVMTDLVAMRGLWERFADAHRVGAIAVLTGSRGCGKSTALKQALEQSKKFPLPKELQTGPALLFDGRILSCFDHRDGAKAYLDRLTHNLERGGLTVIDHFHAWIEGLKQWDLHSETFASLLRTRCGPTILTVDLKNLDLIPDLLVPHEIVDMDHYLMPQLPNVYDHLLKRAEEDWGHSFEQGTRRFFREHIAAANPMNLKLLADFLQLSVARMRDLESALTPLEQENLARSKIAEQCFQTVYEEHFVGQVPLPQPSDGSLEEETLHHIEQLVQKLSDHMFKVPLRYSDRSQSFLVAGKISRKQKLGELKTHLVRLVWTIQSMFPQWFERFWLQLDPKLIQNEVGNNPRKMWSIYCRRTEKMDASYALDAFFQMGRELLLDAMQTRNLDEGH